jgi:hypothetical protein
VKYPKARETWLIIRIMSGEGCVCYTPNTHICSLRLTQSAVRQGLQEIKE